MKSFSAKVVSGKGRGGSIVGFPTMNLVIPPDFNTPEGVYAAAVIANGKEYAGALHYGPTPTFDDTEKALEVYLLDYDGKETPTELTITLKSYLRPVATFLSAKALHDQIEQDVEHVKRALTRTS